MNNLSSKQLKFAIEYAKSSNATESAILAGYSKETAKQQGSRLLTNVAVSQYILLQNTKMEEIFKQEAKNSLHAIILIRDNTRTSDTVRLRACQDILDRAGYGATAKVAGKFDHAHSGNMTMTDNKEVHIIQQLVNTNEELADTILKAMRERNQPLIIPTDE
jgi:shikimate kinase